MDNKGRVTVVLHWDHRQQATHKTEASRLSPKKAEAVGAKPVFPTVGVGGKPAGVGEGAAAASRPALVIQTSLEKLGIHSTVSRDGKKETLINDVYPPRYSPQITVINHDDVHTAKVSSSYGAMSGVQSGARLIKQGSSFESTTIHIHTPECANHVHQPRSGSPAENNECDFHCCALHEEGRKIQVHKSVATSPIQDAQQDVRRPLPKGAHVRFLDIESEGAAAASRIEHESSESETENTIMEEEAITTEKFLLLIDQLSVDQKRHLTIKDIGIILERLSSKIVDVERLDRESESDDCYNWTIKATIRGNVLRELGVIYNGNYYAISEHPGYKEESEENREDIEEEEEEDRL